MIMSDPRGPSRRSHHGLGTFAVTSSPPGHAAVRLIVVGVHTVAVGFDDSATTTSPDRPESQRREALMMEAPKTEMPLVEAPGESLVPDRRGGGSSNTPSTIRDRARTTGAPEARRRNPPGGG